jgi:hypothetical protein
MAKTRFSSLSTCARQASRLRCSGTALSCTFRTSAPMRSVTGCIRAPMAVLIAFSLYLVARWPCAMQVRHRVHHFAQGDVRMGAQSLQSHCVVHTRTSLQSQMTAAWRINESVRVSRRKPLRRRWYHQHTGITIGRDTRYPCTRPHDSSTSKARGQGHGGVARLRAGAMPRMHLTTLLRESRIFTPVPPRWHTVESIFNVVCMDLTHSRW